MEYHSKMPYRAIDLSAVRLLLRKLILFVILGLPPLDGLASTPTTRRSGRFKSGAQGNRSLVNVLIVPAISVLTQTDLLKIWMELEGGLEQEQVQPENLGFYLFKLSPLTYSAIQLVVKMIRPNRLVGYR